MDGYIGSIEACMERQRAEQSPAGPGAAEPLHSLLTDSLLCRLYADSLTDSQAKVSRAWSSRASALTADRLSADSQTDKCSVAVKAVE